MITHPPMHLIVTSLFLVIAARAQPADPKPTIVSSTRTLRPAGDQAVRVQVLGRDEIETTEMMTPGSVALAFERLPALRLQNTSPELGMEMVRIDGLPGQYTRLLSEGAPLYFDRPGGLALVQIAPTDLDHVEVITDGASALFGANALSGAIDLLPRRPDKERHNEVLFSQSLQQGTDAAAWISSPATGSWSHALFVGGHKQNERDVDEDGWSDIAGVSRGDARERVFWDNGKGKSAWGTAGVTFEKRKGGSDVARQSLETRGADGMLAGQMPLGRFVLAGSGMLFAQSRVRDFSDRREHERREAATIELELRGKATRQTWVAGVAADWFTIRTPEPLAAAYIAPRGGIFAHDDVEVASWLTVSGSARLDYNKGASESVRMSGFVLSPRGSALVHRGPWSARVSAGHSYYTPSAQTEETEAAGYAHLSIRGPFDVASANSVSADVAHTTAAATVAFTVFHSHVDHPTLVDRATYTLHMDADPLIARGVELLASTRRGPFAVTGTYAFVEAQERGGQDVPLTPRHRARVFAAAEGDRHGRIGIGIDFTGVQRLEANPYRSSSEPYTTVSLLGEHPIGRWRLFATAQNLTDVRQTDWDPIARPAPDVDGRWTVDAWAPLAGRLINFGFRASF